MKQLFYGFLIVVLWSCSKEQVHEKSFYHWKSNFDLSDFETSYLDTLNVKKVYLRFFDVKWITDQNGTFPIAQLKVNDSIDKDLEIVPVVYITNESLQKISIKNVFDLAQNVAVQIQQLAKDNNIPFTKIKEVQFDCDWSETTRAKYFEFLNAIRKGFNRSDLKLSATIRLHQVKYAKRTGTPPVDQGVLMFYNMGKLTDVSTINSILDLETAKKYLYNFDEYDLNFDVALPLFSWGVQFRKGKVVQLLNNLSESDLEENADLVQQENNYFEVKKSTYINDQYVYKGDQIRFESVQSAQLKKASQMLDEVMKDSNYNLIFYHLDEKVLSSYSPQFLKSL